MTLIIVHSRAIIADSHTEFGAYHGSVDKIAELDDIWFTGAGNPSLCAGVARKFVGKTDLQRFDLDLSKYGRDSDHTCVVVISKDSGQVFYVYCGDDNPYVSGIDKYTDEGIGIVTGSGRNFFFPYLSEHRCIGQALALTGKLCPSVNAPMSVLRRAPNGMPHGAVLKCESDDIATTLEDCNVCF